jgi:hypothetical protein
MKTVSQKTFFNNFTEFDGTRIDTAKAEVNKAVESYQKSMNVTNDMLKKLILEGKKDKILDWIWKDDVSSKQNDLHKKRAANTGAWLFETSEFKEWINDGSNVLICRGMRNGLCNFADN